MIESDLGTSGSFRAVAKWLVPSCVGLFFISCFIPLFGFWVVDNGAKYLQMINIAGRHHFTDFSIDYPLKQHDPGFTLNDSKRFQLIPHNGRLYTQYPPAFSWVSGLLYAVIGNPAIRVIPLLGALGVLLATWRLGLLLRIPKPGAAAALALFATPLLPYAFIFWDVLPGIALALAALVMAAHACNSNSPGRDAASSAILAGTVFLLREQYIVWGACVLAFLPIFAATRRAVTIYAIMFIGIVGIVFAANYAMIGLPLFVRVWNAANDPFLSWNLQTRWLVFHKYVTFVTGDTLLDIILFAGVASLAFLRNLRPPLRIFLLTISILCAAVIREFSWDMMKPLVTQFKINSMTSCAPIIFLGLFFWKDGTLRFNRRDPNRFVWSVAISFVLVSIVSSPLTSAVGENFGPRLLLIIYPIFMLRAMAAAFDIIGETAPRRNRAVAILLAALLLFGIADSAVFLYRLRVKTLLSGQIMELVRKTAPLPVLTDVQWLVTEMAPLYYTRPIMAYETPDQKRLAVEVLKEMNATGAILFTYGAPTAEAYADFNIAPLQRAEAIKFPDAAYSFQSHLLSWAK